MLNRTDRANTEQPTTVRPAGSRLSVVLISIVLVTSLGIGLALAAALGANTYGQQQRRIDARITELLESNAGGLTLALWTFDRAAVELQLKGMTNTFPVKAAEILVADGSVIRTADVPADAKPSRSRRLVRISPVDGLERTLGTLNIYLDHGAAEARVIVEVRNLVLVVIVSSVLIALVVALIMQKLIAAPLRRLADQLHLITAGGKPIEVNYDTGNPLRLRILEIDELVRDINTSRAQADAMTEKRRESEQRFRDLAEVSSDWFWETDAAMRLSYLSDRFYQLTGYAPADCIGFPTEKFAAGRIDGPRWTRQRGILTAHRPFREFVYDLDAADGRRLTVSVNGTPLFDAAGAFAGYRGTASDITARRIAEEARDEALQRAEYANQAKSEFMATMSHEFRTPLNAILGFSEMMRSRVFGPLGSDTYDDYANAIHSSGNHMLTLVNDVLDISAIETGHRAYAMEAVDTEDVVRGCLAEIANFAAERDVGLGYVPDAPVPPCYADRRSVRQIVTNLLSNAIKYNKMGGEVRVSVAAGDGVVEIIVADTGIGIPADRMNAILEPFIQADTNPLRTNDGAGLGLSIVRSLVEAHNGTLAFESELGTGTTVRVTLPMFEAAAG